MIKYTMFENGLDFILDSILHLQKAESDGVTEDAQARELKYALLHLSSGIELVFKSRLRNAHWTYIFADMNTAKWEKYIDGSLKTVDSNTAIERLENLCRCSFSDSAKKALKRLRDTRNRFEHGEIANHPKAIENIINDSLSVAIEFIQNNYDELEMPNSFELIESMDSICFSEKEKELYKNITSETAKLKQHHDDAVKLALKRALEVTLEEDLIICPECGERLFRHADGYGNSQCECFFCGYSDIPDRAARKYVEQVLNISEYETVKDGGEFPVYQCPGCMSDALVYIEEEEAYFCLGCGMRYEESELGFCNICGQLYEIEEDGLSVCSHCAKLLMDEAD